MIKIIYNPISLHSFTLDDLSSRITIYRGIEELYAKSAPDFTREGTDPNKLFTEFIIGRNFNESEQEKVISGVFYRSDTYMGALEKALNDGCLIFWADDFGGPEVKKFKIHLKKVALYHAIEVAKLTKQVNTWKYCADTLRKGKKP